MPFRYAPQQHIANGSTLVLLDVEGMRFQDLHYLRLEAGQWANLVAYIKCETLPPSGDAQAVINHFARALFLDVSASWWNETYACLRLAADGHKHAHVVFREKISGALDTRQKYLHSSAKGKERFWRIVHHLEYGGVADNKVLDYNRAHEYLIRPWMIAGHLQEQLDQLQQRLSLQFPSELATQVGCRLVQLWLTRRSWRAFERGCFQRLAKGMGLEFPDFLRGVQELADLGYVQPMSHGSDECFVREKLVEKVWRASLLSQ